MTLWLAGATTEINPLLSAAFPHKLNSERPLLSSSSGCRWKDSAATDSGFLTSHWLSNLNSFSFKRDFFYATLHSDWRQLERARIRPSSLQLRVLHIYLWFGSFFKAKRLQLAGVQRQTVTEGFPLKQAVSLAMFLGFVSCWMMNLRPRISALFFICFVKMTQFPGMQHTRLFSHMYS